MIELQKTVKQLREMRRYYAVKINEIGGSLVFITLPDFNAINLNLSNLIKQVKPFSECISNMLEDIRRNLFCFNNGLYTFNPYRFGALGVILDYLSSEDFICNVAKYLITPWQDVNEALTNLLLEASEAKVRLDYNKVGVVARELYIMLARKVYNKDKHVHPEGKKISASDAKGMLTSYIECELHDDKLKKYIFDAIELAEPVTHTKEINKMRMNDLMIAVISVVGLVNNIQNNEI